MERTPILETTSKVDQKVLVKGWVRLVRDHGKVTFADVRDYSGVIQVVFVSNETAKTLRGEDVVEIEGVVQARKAGSENLDLKTGSMEILAENIKILEKSHELPIDMGAKELNVELPTLLDYRTLTLRHPKVAAIFKIQSLIVDGFREALKKKGFTEFFAPALVPTATEGGAEIFKVNYYDYFTYLAQSPQLYKQIMVGVFERAFTVGKAYRAEPSVTTRHLSEYVTLDAEFGFIDSYKDVMGMAEYVVKYIFAKLNEEGADYLKLFGATTPLTSEKLPSITVKEALEIVYKTTGRDIRNEPDLDPQGERDICTWSTKEFGSEMIFITEYPTKKRPFYTYADPERPEVTHSFDLLGRGLEWITGGRRINNYEQLLSNLKKWGNKEKDFDMYLQAFKYGMPPEGGFALGAERITMQILGLSNVREASSFPRDMERADVLLKNIQ